MFAAMRNLCSENRASVSVKKNLAYNFLLSLSQVLFPLLSIPWLTRVLDPQGLGRVQFTDSLVYYFVVLAEAGIATHAVRAVARSRNDPGALRRLVSELLSLHLLTSLLATFLYAGTVWFLYERIGNPLLVAWSLSFLLLNGFACEWYFWGTENFRYIALRTLAVRALALLSLFLLVHQPEHYARHYAIIVSSALAILAINLGSVLRAVRPRFRNLNWRPHLKVMRATYAISLLYSIPLLLDNVLLGLVAGTAAVALYAYAVRLVRLFSAFITDAFQVLYPRMVALGREEDRERRDTALRLSAEALLLLSVPAGAALWVVAEPFTRLYLGAGFAGVAGHLKVLAPFPALITATLFLTKQVLLPRDQERRVLISLSLGAGAFLLLALLLARAKGGTGMAWALNASETVVLAANLYGARRAGVRLRLPLGTFLLALLTAGLFLLAGHGYHRLGLDGIAFLLAFTGSGGLIYLLLLRLFRAALLRQLFFFFFPSKSAI